MSLQISHFFIEFSVHTRACMQARKNIYSHNYLYHKLSGIELTLIGIESFYKLYHVVNEKQVNIN